MKPSHGLFRALLALCFALCAFALVHAQPAPQLPVLAWQQRSDWLNVKTMFGAVGNGVADDTAAIQAALNLNNNSYNPRAVYLPPGTYRITSTLSLTQNTGGLIIGHGRDTRIVWDGPLDGVMFWSNGATRFRFVGIIWDGRSIAGIGVEHNSHTLYETSIRHQNEQFIDFRIAGIQVNDTSPTHSAEIYVDHCLFYRCNKGFSTLKWNSYNNIFNGCEFHDNNHGIYFGPGNGHVRNCRFERSAIADIHMQPHSNSVRRCVSIGSHRFIEITQTSNNTPLMVQDCRVDGWTSPQGAIYARSRGPLVILDTAFTNPPSTGAPIVLANWSGCKQAVVVSNNSHPGATALIAPGANSTIHSVPAGALGASAITTATRFFKQSAFVPTSIIDVKVDHGALGNNVADDTAAINAAIAVAKARGNGCMVYLPHGTYKLGGTLNLQGGVGDFAIGGSGFRTILNHTSNPGILLKDPQNLRVEQMRFTAADSITKVRQTSTANTASFASYDGLYVSNPNFHPINNPTYGLSIIDLPAQASVLIDHLYGDAWFRNSSQGIILANFWIDGALRVSNSGAPRTGFLGVNTRVTSRNAYDTIVYDHESVVIGDAYTEQTERALNTQNSSSTASGRITIRYTKLAASQVPTIAIGNYRGRVSIFGGLFYPQNPTTITHNGTNPLDLILCGNSFFYQAPQISLSPSATPVFAKNIIQDNANGMFENTITAAGAAELAAALDHFRELGLADLALNHGL